MPTCTHNMYISQDRIVKKNIEPLKPHKSDVFEIPQSLQNLQQRLEFYDYSFGISLEFGKNVVENFTVFTKYSYYARVVDTFFLGTIFSS